MAVNLFDANAYRAANSDLPSFSNAQALSHFQNYGMNEGRTFSPFVNLNFYRASNSDLAGLSNRQLFDHLQNYGIREGRSFSPLVDVNIYRAYNNDLSAFNNEQLFEHLRNWGMGEGRSFSPFVNLNVYRAANPDLSAARIDNNQLFNHLAFYGVGEGRRFSVSFDSNFYRNTNSDLATLNHSQLLDHFERYGLNEGRASSESFNVKYYLDNNSDLKAFNKQQAQQHFEIFGCREGRRGAALSPITISTDPGNTLGTAFNIGFLNGNRTISNQFVGSVDPTDFYRFTLANNSNFNTSLSGLSGQTKIDLILDKNNNGVVDSGDSLYYDYGYSNDSASISLALGAGTYFIRVSTYDYSGNSTNTNTKYTLSFSATTSSSTTPRDPGDTLGTALDLGYLSGDRSFQDFVGSVDPTDYYRFTLANTTNFNASLSGLSNYTTLELILDRNNNGVVDSSDSLYYEYGYNNNNASISSALGAGTYFIQVKVSSDSSTNTNYTLSFSATASSSTTPRDPGDTLGTAVNIGYLSGGRFFQDFVGSVDPTDYYRFTLANNSNFNASLSGLSDQTTLQLILDRNNNGVVDSSDSLYYDYGYSYENASISSALGAGTYFIRVSTNSYWGGSTSTNTNYTLSLFA